MQTLAKTIEKNLELENTITSTDDKPPNGTCQGCGKTTTPVFTEGPVGMRSYWRLAAKQCDACLEKQLAYVEQQKEIKRLNEAYVRAKVPKRAREQTFANFRISQDNQNAYQAARAFQINPEGRGLMLYGEFGVGKTHLAAAIANQHVDKVSLLYRSCPELLFEIRNTFQTHDSSNKLEEAMRVELLILDDIGAEKPSDWVRETLFLLVNHRYEARLPTVYTSNLDLEALEQNLTGRIASRIAETCDCLSLGGEDQRIKGQGKVKPVNFRAKTSPRIKTPSRNLNS